MHVLYRHSTSARQSLQMVLGELPQLVSMDNLSDVADGILQNVLLPGRATLQDLNRPVHRHLGLRAFLVYRVSSYEVFMVLQLAPYWSPCFGVHALIHTLDPILINIPFESGVHKSPSRLLFVLLPLLHLSVLHIW